MVVFTMRITYITKTIRPTYTQGILFIAFGPESSKSKFDDINQGQVHNFREKNK